LQEKEQNQNSQTTPSIHRRELWEVLGKGVGSTFTFPPVYVFQLTREFFTKELKKHYLRNNDTDVFSSTWNSVMITVSQAVPVTCGPWSVAVGTALSPHHSSPGSACFGQPIASRAAPAFGPGGRREFSRQPVLLKASCRRSRERCSP